MLNKNKFLKRYRINSYIFFCFIKYDMIKSVKPNNKKFKQGYFTPNNPEKYSGKMPIIYRSSWEYKFMTYCDNNTFIVRWGSENVEIPYIYRIDNKQHRYYPDFFIISNKDGVLTKYIVEIKPKQHLQKPTPPKKATKKSVESYRYLSEQFIKNMDKYKYAKIFAEKNNCRFIVLTEDNLSSLG